MCKVCDDSGWVCEEHPSKPWEDSDSSRSCDCGGAGMPCECNNTDIPKFPPDYRIINSVNMEEIDKLH